MSTRDGDLNVRLPQEPEEEQPIGTSAEAEWPPNGLASDPYAEDMPLTPARAGVPRWLLIVISIALIVALLIAAAAGSRLLW